MTEGRPLSRIPNIYLCGLIGTGKTTIGRALAEYLGRPFHDLDEVITAEAGADLHALVAAETWLGFRAREYETVKRFAAMPGVVIGLGGGTVRYAWNRDAMEGTGTIVLLTADIDVLAERASIAERPRVNQDTSQADDLKRIWEENKDTYLAAADHVYSTDAGKTVTQEVEEIAQLVGGPE